MATSQPVADSSKKDEPKKGRFPIIKLFAALVMILVLTVTATLAGLYYQWSRRSLPQIDGEIRLNGLKSEVKVRRDKWGVPYITAANDEDLLFAEGYVMAQDRLWQMDMFRRAAGGRLSEILGADQLEFDKRQRTLGFRRVAEL